MSRKPTPNIMDELLPAKSETTELRAGLKWDYSQLGEAAGAVIEHTIEIKRNERRANEAAVEAGRHLIAVKESLSHGQWGDWLETEFAMSDSTAQTMMNIARRFGANSQPVGNLSYSVLGLLASPSVPEAAVNEVIQRSQAGDDVTKATAKRVIEQYKPTPKRTASGLPALDMQPPIAPGSPEAKQLTKEIKAGTWGDRIAPPTPVVVDGDRPLPDWAAEDELEETSTDKIIWTHEESPCRCTPEHRQFCHRCGGTGIYKSARVEDEPDAPLPHVVPAQLVANGWMLVAIGDGTYLMHNADGRETDSAEHIDECIAQAQQMDENRLLYGEPQYDAPLTAADVEVLRPAPVSQREGYDSDEWYSPGWVIEAARSVMGEIDLDPASCELAQETVQAGLFWAKRQDGCRMSWFGRVWLNPPYSAPGAFVEKLIEEYAHGNVAQACVLLNNATETKWFQRLLARFPVCFFGARLAFWRHDHEDVGARQGQALFYLGPDVERFVEVFGEHGIVVKRLD